MSSIIDVVQKQGRVSVVQTGNVNRRGKVHLIAEYFTSKRIMCWQTNETQKPKSASEKKEFAITILHELIHFMHNGSMDKESTSEDEARFDLQCYMALNLNIPANHWAWKRLDIDIQKKMQERSGIL